VHIISSKIRTGILIANLTSRLAGKTRSGCTSQRRSLASFAQYDRAGAVIPAKAEIQLAGHR
jgi:hypothetical protein